MPSERVIEIPWALSQLPQTGVILDVGSCRASYLAAIQQPDRLLHCLDPRACASDIPDGSVFYQQDIIGNTLPRAFYDAVVAVSTLEHIGLSYYEQAPFPEGDRLALGEIRSLLKPTSPAIVTLPAGRSKITSWYRQYSPSDLHWLFHGWTTRLAYWGFNGTEYVPIDEASVTKYDYREPSLGAGALAVIIATPEGFRGSEP